MRRYLTATTVLVLAGGSALMTGCGRDLPSFPPTIDAETFCDSGWVEYQLGNFNLARELFENAIELDGYFAEAYLGAGMSTLHLPGYWSWGPGYFYLAAELSGGASPVLLVTESQEQDSAATVFEMLTDTTGSTPWPGSLVYRFPALNEGLLTIHLINITEHTGITTPVDSILRSGSDTWAYVTVGPFEVDPDTAPPYNTWIDSGFTVTYEYSFSSLINPPQIALDAMLGYSILEKCKQESGDHILGTGVGWGAALLGGSSYYFGEAEGYEGVETMYYVDACCAAAQQAFYDQAFMIAWQIVKEAGYGESLDPTDPGFVYELMMVIDSMQD